MESELVPHQKDKEENGVGNVVTDNNNIGDLDDATIKVQKVVSRIEEGLKNEGNTVPELEINSISPERVARRKTKPKRHGLVKRELTPVRLLGDGIGGRNNKVDDPNNITNNGVKDRSSSSTSEVNIPLNIYMKRLFHSFSFSEFKPTRQF